MIDNAIPIVSHLIAQSHQHQPFSLSGVDLTQVLLDKFSTVVQLQTYLIDQSMPLLQQQYTAALHHFIASVIISMIAFMAAFMTLFYSHTRIFKPLIEIRQMLLSLLTSAHVDTASSPANISLFETIQKIQHHLQQRDALQRQLQYIAHTDALTGIANRLALADYIAVLEHDPIQLCHTGLLIVDIDDLKTINDCAGHMIGDQMIQYVATQLKTYLTQSDRVIRYGGDEFVVILTTTTLADMTLMAEKIRQEIAQKKLTITATQQLITLSVSIGIALGAATWHELFNRADQSLLKAKATGKNKILVSQTIVH